WYTLLRRGLRRSRRFDSLRARYTRPPGRPGGGRRPPARRAGGRGPSRQAGGASAQGGDTPRAAGGRAGGRVPEDDGQGPGGVGGPSRQAGVPRAQAGETPRASEAPAVERVPEEDGQDPEAVDCGGDEPRRRRLWEVARRHRDLGDPEPRGHDLRDDLLVE